MSSRESPSPDRTVAEPILHALEKVVASDLFVNSPQMARLLRFVVLQTVNGQTGDLKEFRIGLEVFGRGNNYDPRLDPVVRVEARRLRSKLAEYYSGRGTEDELVIGIPKGGYVAHFERRIAAPAAPRAEPPVVPSGWGARHWTMLLVLSLTLGTVIFLGVSSVRAARPASQSLAVLPFLNLSADPANRYFADGLTDEITDGLARLRGLRVVARASSSQFHPGKQDIREIGEKLGVSMVLEGSVARSGNRVKIIAELENAADGSRLWSHTYERPVVDLFAVQSDIAQGIASSLKASIDPAPAAHQSLPNEQARESFLKGRYEANLLTSAGLNQAVEDYGRAIQQDPTYGKAYDYLAVGLFNQRSFAFRQPERQRIEQLWRKALELDPSLASPHSGLGMIAAQFDWDWTQAQHELQTALSLSSSATVEMDQALLYVIHQRFEEADTLIRQARDHDPLGPETLYTAALLHMLEGRFSQSQNEFQTMADRRPGSFASLIMLNGVFVYQGQPQRAIDGWRKLESKVPSVRVLEAIAKAHQGKREEALKLAAPFEQNYSKMGVPLYWFALLYASLDDQPKAVEWLTRSADAREYQAMYIRVEPLFQNLHSNPAFQSLTKRMGLL